MAKRRSPLRPSAAGHSRGDCARRAPRRPVSIWPADAATSPHSQIERIASAISPDDGDWLRGLGAAIDPAAERYAGRRARDDSLRAAAALMRTAAPSAAAKAIETELRNYLSRAWWRGERDLPAPPAHASELRQHMWRVAKLTQGEGLGWRRILQILEI